MPRRPPAVARVLTQVTATIRAHDLVAPGDLVLVSISGGPDSVCLLYALWHLRRLFKVRLAAFHFDHRLRTDSGKDAVYIERVCARLHVPALVRAADGAPSKGQSVEAWASAARTHAANEVRLELGAQALAEGHTLDDQAETVLVNLVRGTGLEGMSGIDPGGHGAALIQPLLDVTRSDVEAFCGALHLRPRRDPMNEDRRYLRAAIRHDLLPLVERTTGREVKGSIARTAATLRADLDELRAVTVEAFRDVADDTVPDVVRFDVARLLVLPEPIARRVIRLGAYRVIAIDASAPWTKAGIDAVFDLAHGRPGRRVDLPDGMVARRTRTHVVVSRER
jgi:tRNA(Ile)-lysidine synthase